MTTQTGFSKDRKQVVPRLVQTVAQRRSLQVLEVLLFRWSNSESIVHELDRITTSNVTIVMAVVGSRLVYSTSILPLEPLVSVSLVCLVSLDQAVWRTVRQASIAEHARKDCSVCSFCLPVRRSLNGRLGSNCDGRSLVSPWERTGCRLDRHVGRPSRAHANGSRVSGSATADTEVRQAAAGTGWMGG